jgi:hypothetical protein
MNIQNKLLDFSEKLLRKSNLSDNIICNILRFFHTIFPLAVAYIILFGSKKMFFFIMVGNIIIYVLFFIFNGCILTRLEKRFCDTDFIVIDPVLEYLDIPINHDTRFKYTVYWFIFNFTLALGIYYYRFMRNKTDTEIKTI